MEWLSLARRAFGLVFRWGAVQTVLAGIGAVAVVAVPALAAQVLQARGDQGLHVVPVVMPSDLNPEGQGISSSGYLGDGVSAPIGLQDQSSGTLGGPAQVQAVVGQLRSLGSSHAAPAGAQPATLPGSGPPPAHPAPRPGASNPPSPAPSPAPSPQRSPSPAPSPAHSPSPAPSPAPTGSASPSPSPQPTYHPASPPASPSPEPVPSPTPSHQSAPPPCPRVAGVHNASMTAGTVSAHGYGAVLRGQQLLDLNNQALYVSNTDMDVYFIGFLGGGTSTLYPSGGDVPTSSVGNQYIHFRAFTGWVQVVDQATDCGNLGYLPYQEIWLYSQAPTGTNVEQLSLDVKVTAAGF
ncbi:MAG: hypothetical protein ACYDAY_04875 [Candidatus Dormibacteria bacterium]